jgi:hypothetical protein
VKVKQTVQDYLKAVELFEQATKEMEAANLLKKQKGKALNVAQTEMVKLKVKIFNVAIKEHEID